MQTPGAAMSTCRPPVAEIGQGVVHVGAAGRGGASARQAVEIRQGADHQDIVEAGRAVVIGVVVLIAGGNGEGHTQFTAPWMASYSAWLKPLPPRLILATLMVAACAATQSIPATIQEL